jgi:hypothetical protein
MPLHFQHSSESIIMNHSPKFRRTMSDAELIGWTCLGALFVAPFVAALLFVVNLPSIPGLS